MRGNVSLVSTEEALPQDKAEEAERAGANARYGGADIDECPYNYPESRESWKRGWRQADWVIKRDRKESRGEILGDETPTLP